MRYSLHLVAVVSARSRGLADILTTQMGWGPGNFTVPLTRGTTTTHYGLACPVTPHFVELIENAEADQKAVIDLLTINIEPVGARAAEDHFAAVLAEQGLRRVVTDAGD